MKDAFVIFFYRGFNFLVALMPATLARWVLRVFHLRKELAERAGYLVYPKVFYNPYPDPAEVDAAKLELKRDLPGVTLDEPACLQLLKELEPFSAEVRQFVASRTGNLEKWDFTYPPADAGTHYAMLRQLKPKRYIEVGCGWSTRSSIAALEKNLAEEHPCESVFIEPYPPPYFTELKLPGEFLQQKIEQVPLDRFTKLEAGDVLFIDTSHVIKTQNDVEYEFLHILPSLKPGVIVHIHDIFTPYDYPAEWLIGNGGNRGGNNEQYALECLLSGGHNWKIILPVFLLWKDHPEAFKRLVDSPIRAGAMWIKKSG